MEWNWNWNDFFGKVAGVIVTIILTIVLGLMGVNKWVAQLIAGEGGDIVEEASKKKEEDKGANFEISEAEIIKIREEERIKIIQEIFKEKENEQLKKDKEQFEKDKSRIDAERRQASLREQQRQRELKEENERIRREKEEMEKENQRIREEKEKQERITRRIESERSLERDRKKVRSQLSLDTDYEYYIVLGGIENAYLYIYNNSDYYVDKIIIKVEYVRDNGNIYNTVTVTCNGIKANSKITHRLPDSGAGKSLTAYITSFYCSAIENALR
jgi:hypothetical protein